MAHDVELATRMRELLEGEPGITEKKMFGGLALVVEGAMAIAASGQGGALVRVDPSESDHLVDTTSAEVAVMQGRPMSGWLRVPAEELVTDEQVGTWVRIGMAYARSLPVKG
ncbi:MAG TPA: TfoX/Sxy family protein [Candidatus Nanopelagicales bacterium]